MLSSHESRDVITMKVVVCIGSSCHLKGSHQVVSCIKRLIDENGIADKVELSGSFCFGQCQNDVGISIDGVIHSVKPEDTPEFFKTEILDKLA